MSAQESTTGKRRSPGSIVMIVIGSVVGLLSLAVLAGGGGVLWADKSQRDSAGYFTTSTHRFAAGSYALTHEGIDIGDLPTGLDRGRLADVRVRATAGGADKAIFVGIGREAAVNAYLANVAHTRVTDVNYDPFRASYETVSSGAATPVAPTAAKLWVVSASGPGAQSITWPVQKGHWSVVVMNADGSRNVAADMQFGADVHHLGWIAIGLLLGGGVLLALAVLLVALGVRGSGGASPGVAGASAPASGPDRAPTAYPALIEGRLDEPLSRWLWLVKWFLAIPHFVVLAFLWVAFAVLTVVAWFAILFTGRYPRGIFDFNVGVLRWSWRVGYYATSALGTDRYPPFSLGEEPDYPATLSVAYPERLSRGLVLVKWLLAFPHYLVVGLISGGAWFGWTAFHADWASTTGGGLIGILVVVAGVVLLFTGNYPRPLYDFVLGLNRWVLRVTVYTSLMRDEYPPFRLDQGGDEPPPAEASSLAPVAA